MSLVFVQLDKPFYFAGDTIQGQVFLNLVETINANEVMVKFKGWQSVRWIQERVLMQQERQNIQNNLIWNNVFNVHMESSDSQDHPGQDESMKFRYVRRGNDIIEIKRYSGERIIAKFAHCLFNFGGSFIPPGQYSFPFCFKTSQEYPASFMDKSVQDKRKGRIKYELQAFIRGFNNRLRLIKTKSEIVLRETTVIKNDKQQIQANVKSCCCIDQGITRIRCFFEKNAYSPGEDAKIYCVVNNKQGKTEVQRVSVSLINEITYTSAQNHRKTVTNHIFQSKFSGLPAGEEGQRQQVVKIVNQRNKVNPMDIKPTSSKGTRLKSIYYLQIEAVLAASCTCCSQLPVVKQPILIYPWFPNQAVFQKPSIWNPEVMQMVNIQMNATINNNKMNAMGNPYP